MQFTVSNRHHFDREVPCIHVTLDYFEILFLLCHQGNNILIPPPAKKIHVYVLLSCLEECVERAHSAVPCCMSFVRYNNLKFRRLILIF